jgi:hypothetical protein
MSLERIFVSLGIAHCSVDVEGQSLKLGARLFSSVT